MALSKKAIEDYLIQSGDFLKSVDGWLVDEMVYTIKLLHEVKKQIRQDDNKIMVDVSSDANRIVMQPSAAFASYRALIKQALEIGRQLGLGPRARKELQQKLEGPNDGF